MEYILSKFKIKEGKLKITRDFLEDLNNNNQEEMKEVLSEAKMILDCSFIDSIHNDNYLYIFKKLENNEILKDKIANSKLKIYDKIREWATECLEGGNDTKAITAFESKNFYE